MPSVNDILQFTVKGNMHGDDVLNVFHYLVADVDSQNSNLPTITLAWFATFDTQILSLLSQRLEITEVQTVNLSDPNEIYQGGVTANGDGQLECLPVHDSMSVKLSRSTGVTRNGRKSFAGIPETKQADGQLQYTGVEIQQIETYLSSPVELDLNADPQDLFILNPVIVGRTKNAQGKYELDLSKINNINGAVVNPFVRTQLTRQRKA